MSWQLIIVSAREWGIDAQLHLHVIILVVETVVVVGGHIFHILPTVSVFAHVHVCSTSTRGRKHGSCCSASLMAPHPSYWSHWSLNLVSCVWGPLHAMRYSIRNTTIKVASGPTGLRVSTASRFSTILTRMTDGGGSAASIYRNSWNVPLIVLSLLLVCSPLHHFSTMAPEKWKIHKWVKHSVLFPFSSLGRLEDIWVFLLRTCVWSYSSLFCFFSANQSEPRLEGWKKKKPVRYSKSK